MTSPQSEAEAIEAVRLAILKADEECPGDVEMIEFEAKAALSVAKPHIEKALFKRILSEADKVQEDFRRWQNDMDCNRPDLALANRDGAEKVIAKIRRIARDLGYGDID